MEEFKNFSVLATKYTIFIVINEEIEWVQALSPQCIIPFFHFFSVIRNLFENSKKQNVYNVQLFFVLVFSICLN